MIVLFRPFHLGLIMDSEWCRTGGLWREASRFYMNAPVSLYQCPPQLIPLCPPLLIVCTRLIIVCKALLYQLKFLISEMQSIDSYHGIVIEMFCYFCFRIGYCIIKFISMEKTTHDRHLFWGIHWVKVYFLYSITILVYCKVDATERAELTVPTYTRSRIC